VAQAKRVEALVARAGLPVSPPTLGLDRWLDLMSHDKKVQAGVITFILLHSIGEAAVRSGVARETLERILGR
jgi:3-dehydroquinate synthase